MGDDADLLRSVPSVTYSTKQVRRIRELLALFYGARRAAQFYPAGHPAVTDAIDDLMKRIAAYHAEGVDVVLTFFEDELLLGEQLLPTESVLFDQLIRDMVAIGAGSIALLRGLDARELSSAVSILALGATPLESMGGLDEVMKRAMLGHVRVTAVSVADRSEPLAAGQDRESAQESYRLALELMRDIERLMRTQSTIQARAVRGVVRTLLDNVLNNRYAMLELSGLKDYDEYTFYHSINVTILSLALGAMITREPRFLASLGSGALMHDIGKIVIDVATLNKPGALSADEWTEVRKHPVNGAEQAASTSGLDKSAVVVILEHHMRFDNCGYPQRFPVRSQHLASRIVALADAYDAMTSVRSYSAARLPDEAMGVLAQNAGTSFDPKLVRLFVRMLGCYPPRSVVRLTSGEVAVVMQANEEDPVRPLVRVFAGASGDMIEPRDLDLADDHAAADRGIERCLDPAGLNVDVAEFLQP